MAADRRKCRGRQLDFSLKTEGGGGEDYGQLTEGLSSMRIP